MVRQLFMRQFSLSGSFRCSVAPAGVKFNEGYAHWEAVTVGGVDKNGYDATNDLTYILLENKREFPLNYPDLAARVHCWN